VTRSIPDTPTISVPAAARSRSVLVDIAAELAPVAAAVVGGAWIGAVVAPGPGLGAGGRDLVSVALLGFAVGAAVVPRAARGVGAHAGLVGHAPVLAAQRVFVVALLGLIPFLLAGQPIPGGLGWIPVLLLLQTALALGLAFLARATEHTRVGRRVPARALVPIWILATPAAWLVHAPAAGAPPAWNPLHHLVVAWRSILLPGVGAPSEPGHAVLALAPAALLAALLGFAALAAVEGEARER
jgi:hypothetical protein